jgi:hypothetical protein
MLSDPKRRTVWHIWHHAWLDSQHLLGKRDISITQAEIRDLFQKSNLEPDTTKYRVVPRNPCTPLTTENASLVTLASRKALMALWRSAKSPGCEALCISKEWLLHAGPPQSSSCE